MVMNPQALLDLDIPETCQSYDWRDAVLYALGIGIGATADDEAQYPFLRSPSPQIAPTFATVLGYQGFWVEDLPTGIDVNLVLHAEQSLSLTRALPCSGDVRRKTRVKGILDKGPAVGSLVFVEEEILDSSTSERLARLSSVLFCRGDGGGGGTVSEAPLPQPIPDRQPDVRLALETSAQQALVYRMSGDDNPLHYDREAARRAGFERPILQGLCIYGMAGQALLMSVGGGEPSAFRTLSARFKAPVFPGEVLELQIWKEMTGTALFRVKVRGREVVAMDNGRFDYDPKGG